MSKNLSAPQHKRVIAVHLLNNYSGSPRVFAAAIEAVQASGAEVTVFTSSGPGFLDGAGDKQAQIHYCWHANKWIRLWNFLWSQIGLMLRLLLFYRNVDTIYINTLLPFGAALAGWLKGCKVVYHFHETHVSPPSLNRFLRFCARLTARQGIAVSAYLKEVLDLASIPMHIIPNALPAELAPAAPKVAKTSPFTVLMIASLKKEKGLWEYIEIAKRLPEVQFELVIGASKADVEAFWGNALFPSNFRYFAQQADVKPFYQKAHLLVNLSNPTTLPETFGMTIIEGMAYGLPAIVPYVGGPAELVEDSREGFVLDVSDVSKVVDAIGAVASDRTRWEAMSKAALEKSREFKPEVFVQAISSFFS